jgi:hypothetical protein
MLQNVVILVFTALASSVVWWRSRFKICRRCRSRIRPSVCHVCGAENRVSLSLRITQNGCLLHSFSLYMVGGGAKQRRSFRVYEENGAKAEPGEAIYAAVPDEIII